MEAESSYEVVKADQTAAKQNNKSLVVHRFAAGFILP